jgi:hypothetical protein
MARSDVAPAVCAWRMVGCKLVAGSASGLGSGEIRAAQDLATRLCGLEGVTGALTDHAAFLFSENRIQVQHERVRLGSERRHQERHLVGHKPADEVDITGQAIELGHDYRAALAFPCLCECCRKLWPAIERISALAGLDTSY